MTFLKNLLAFFFVSSIIFTTLIFPVEAEESVPAQAPVTIAGGDGAACSVWRGKIVYSEETSGGGRSSVPFYGTDIDSFTNRINGEITLNGAAQPQGRISVQSKQKIETVGERKNCCWANLAGCQKETTEKWNYTSESDGAGTGEGEATGEVRVSGNRYKIKFVFPRARGRGEMRHSKTISGSCAESMNKSESVTLPEPDKFFPEVQFQTESTLDPKNPNVLQGKYSPAKGVLIEWNLTRVPGANPAQCEGDLMLSGLKTEHRVFPNKTEWQPIGAHTVDGNQVRLRATVSNGARQSKSGAVTFREALSGEVLGTKSVSVPPGGETEVEVLWDTNGYAWSELGEKMPERRIVASLSNGDYTDAEIKVYPKPVILVHGLWSNAAAWSEYPGYLREAHSFAWRGYAVGADPANGKMNTGESAGNYEPTYTIFQNAQELGKQIKAAQTEMNAWHVDIVAHSMGGLISRFYIHSFMPTDSPDGKPYISHLVMLGTPNMGSPCGDVAYAGYKEAGFEVEALRQLKPSVVEEFNRVNTNRKDVKFSILSGIPVPRTCQSSEWGDGVVTIRSALWQIKDRAFAPRIHTALTGKRDFEEFVKPRLALGPKKARQEQTATRLEKTINESSFASIDPLAALAFPAQRSEPRVSPAKIVKIAPETKTDVIVNFPANAKSGVTFVAPPDVTVTLVRETEEETEQLQTEQEDGLFRTIYADGKPGNWTLRFENAGEREISALYMVWTETGSAASLVLLEAHGEDGTRVYLKAKLTNGGAPAVTAPLTAKLTADGKTVTAQLFDDGDHDDGEAGDGIYGGRTPDGLASGDYAIEVVAGADTATGFIRF